jgi:hypothetical protein
MEVHPMVTQPRSLGSYLVLTVLVLFAIKNPVAAANLARMAGALVYQAAEAFSKIFHLLPQKP